MYLFNPAPRLLLFRTRVQAARQRPLATHTHRQRALNSVPRRSLASSPSAGKNPVDEKVDGIAEQYAIAKDEFEIAVEETEKKSIYAADDRATVREELEKLETLINKTIGSSSPEQGEEIKRRVSQRVRELKNAVEGLNKADLED